MNEYTKQLFTRGYVRLPLGSYRIWMGKKWHEMLMRRGLIQKNLYGQYSPVKVSIAEFIEWLTLYDKAMHDRDYPSSYKQLTPEESIKIRAAVV